MLRIAFALLLLISTSACAQDTAADREPNREHAAAPAVRDGFVGVWVPYSKSYQPFGNLTIEAEVLSWGTCRRAPYRVLQNEGAVTLIELLGSPPCKLSGEARFLVLDLSKKGLEVSICRERDEFNRPPTEKFCSWGVLYRQDD